MSSGYSAGEDFDHILLDLIHRRGGSDQADLIREILTTGLKLVDEKTDRGDLKIINTAVKELRYAFKVFSKFRFIRKVSVFGSARSKKTSAEYRRAKAFAKKVVRKKFMVITGAASGVMEAANAGAGQEHGFGINIRLPHEQEANPFIQDDRLINFKYFFTRKLVFIKESDAVVLFPGGFGTHDEGFEVLTLIQTGKSHPLPIIMVDDPARPYWRDWFRFVKKQLLDRGYISPEDRDLFKITTDLDEAVDEITRFYSNYQSSRFVRDLFVVRAKRVSAAMIDGLNRNFKDLLAPSARFEQVPTFPEEIQEGRDLELPRIAFHFNRSSYGRIRQLIDFINDFK
ncbi:MAG: TIGR00730 family Rossman fold protein [Candidatus Omnitrophica bacterium]|nr:TIGR00730 family Rossman fold protein [Candidatus Omnitrophota bacterium]